MPHVTQEHRSPTTHTNAPRQGDDVSARRDSDEYQAWIRKAADVCEMAAGGNLEVRLLSVKVNGDMARMIHSINSLLDYTDAFVREAKAVLECSAQGKKIFRRVLIKGMNGAFHQASTVINSASHAMNLKSVELEAQETK